MVARTAPRSTLLPAPLLWLALASACGGEQTPGATGSTPAPATQDDASGTTGGAAGARSGRGAEGGLVAGETRPLADESAGALEVELSFTGKVPERFALGAASSPECQHHAEVDQRQNLVLVEDGKLANVFVTLKSGVDPARVPPVPDTPVELDQRGCMYVPRVVGVRVGQKLHVLNTDPTTHNVNLQPKRNRASNRSMGPGQKALEFVFDQRELGILAKCDIHPWMGAQVHVEEHPWFGVSDARGLVELRGVPPGEYVLEARHEVLGSLTGKVQVTAGTLTRLSGTFQAK